MGSRRRYPWRFHLECGRSVIRMEWSKVQECSAQGNQQIAGVPVLDAVLCW